MEKQKDNILMSIDWTTVVLYLMLGTMGWLAICGASYSYIETDILGFFDPTERTGKQAIWIGISIIVGIVLMFIDKRSYEFSSRFIYIALIIVGILTIKLSRDIKGSRSWITIGSFGIQPAEFMKFGTTLALATLMNKYGFSIKKRNDFLKCLGIILLPLAVIICQKETGSALVYLSFFIVLYREGMTGMVLFTAISAIVYFIVGIGYENTFFDELPVSVGHYAVTALIQIFAIGMTAFWCKEKKTALVLLGINATISLLTYWIAIYPFFVQHIIRSIPVVAVRHNLSVDKSASRQTENAYMDDAVHHRIDTLFSLVRLCLQQRDATPPESAHRGIAGIERRPIGSRLQCTPIENCDRLGRAFWQRFPKRNADQAEICTRAGHRLYLLHHRRRTGLCRLDVRTGGIRNIYIKTADACRTAE